LSIGRYRLFTILEFIQIYRAKRICKFIGGDKVFSVLFLVNSDNK